MKLQAGQRERVVLYRHRGTVLCLRDDLQLRRHVGKRKRVVAHHVDGPFKRREEAAFSEDDPFSYPVLGHASDKLGSERKPERLVAEADAQERELAARGLFNDVDDACTNRIQGAWAEDDEFGLGKRLFYERSVPPGDNPDFVSTHGEPVDDVPGK